MSPPPRSRAAALRAWIHAAFHLPQTRAYRGVQGTVWALIVGSIVLLVVEALLPDGSPFAPLLRRIDRVVLAIFAIEIVLRVASYRPPALEVFQRAPLGRLRTHLFARLRYATKPMMLVDLLAVLALFPELRSLRALRLLRLLRTTRVFRYRNPFAIVIQAFEEHGLLFTFAFSVLGVTTALGGTSFYLIESRANPDVGSVLDGIWWALVTITTVGYGDITPVTLLGRIIAGGLMVAGMFTLALFAGIVGSSLVHGMLSIREEQFRMSDYVNHIVVCGYDESSRLLLAALTRELDLNETRVVIFDDQERARDLGPDFLWVQGDATKESELEKVRITRAAAVVVSGARTVSPQAADARTILTIFTIRSYLRREAKQVRHRKSPLYVVAEILDSENVDHALAAGADEVIETRRIGFSMIAHAIRYPGTAASMSGVLTSGAHNVYIGKLPPRCAKKATCGEALAELDLSERGGLVIGMRSANGEDMINPDSSRPLEPGFQVVYLAKKPLLEPPV